MSASPEMTATLFMHRTRRDYFAWAHDTRSFAGVSVVRRGAANMLSQPLPPTGWKARAARRLATWVIWPVLSRASFRNVNQRIDLRRLHGGLIQIFGDLWANSSSSGY